MSLFSVFPLSYSKCYTYQLFMLTAKVIFFLLYEISQNSPVFDSPCVWCVFAFVMQRIVDFPRQCCSAQGPSFRYQTKLRFGTARGLLLDQIGIYRFPSHSLTHTHNLCGSS